MWFSIGATNESQATRWRGWLRRCAPSNATIPPDMPTELLDACRQASVVPIRPSARRLAKRNARIDVAIETPTGCGRHALTIRCVRAVAGNADTPALDTIGIIDRGRGTGAGYRGGTGRHQNQ